MLELNSPVFFELFFLFFLLIICAIIFNNRISHTSVKSEYLLKFLLINLIFESIERLYEIKYNTYIIPTKYYYFSISETIVYSFLIETLRVKSKYIYPIIITYILGVNILYNPQYPPYFLALDNVYNFVMLLYFYFKLKTFIKGKSKRFFIQNKFFIYFVFILLFLGFTYYAFNSFHVIVFYFCPSFIKQLSYLDGIVNIIYLVCFGFLIKQKISFKFKKVRRRVAVFNYNKKKKETCSINEKKDFDELIKTIRLNSIYKNSKVTILNISNSTQMHPKYISKLINTFSDGNFNDFINRLRIEEFKRNLEKEIYKNYSILGVAKESGFSSKSTFYKAFKKHENMSPSMYIKK
ncbi:helix-turn-helix domain-containing protein [Tenacibaculum halocynthiae]|uniref:helix-turn-helix domain-containing protein n=1 Tax=Tenacibaculum halocynthiae TaxID=1254437 RepID=UPI0038943B1C